MIHIELNTKRHKLTVQGHAEPEECGEFRQICSAASALAQAMVYAVTRARDGRLLKGLDYKPDTGDLSAKLYAEDGGDEEMEQIITLYGYGLELLARSHPQSIEMVWDGEKIIPYKEMVSK